MRCNSRSTIAAVALFAVACSDSMSPADGTAPLLGVLQLEATSGIEASAIADAGVRWTVPPGDDVVASPQVLVAPDTVQAGVPFAVTTTTIGMNGCWRADRQEVSSSGQTVQLLPWDVHSGAEMCTEALVYLSHASTVTIAAPGEWTLRVSGRRARRGDTTWETPVAAEKTIIVR